jgi:hypothetical protein
MAYGSVLTDTVQSSTAATPPVFKDGNGTQIGTLCRAWVNFNGTGTVAIRASFNVSSITDNGTGDYTINFTTAMPDANYCFTGVAEPVTSNTNYTVFGATSSSPFVRTTSSIRIRTGYVSSTGGGAAATDADVVNVSIFR